MPVVELFDLISGQSVKSVPLVNLPSALAISPDGSKLAYATSGEGLTILGIVQDQ
jgi:hypothetical protein